MAPVNSKRSGLPAIPGRRGRAPRRPWAERRGSPAPLRVGTAGWRPKENNPSSSNRTIMSPRLNLGLWTVRARPPTLRRQGTRQGIRQPQQARWPRLPLIRTDQPCPPSQRRGCRLEMYVGHDCQSGHRPWPVARFGPSRASARHASESSEWTAPPSGLLARHGEDPNHRAARKSETPSHAFRGIGPHRRATKNDRSAKAQSRRGTPVVVECSKCNAWPGCTVS